MRHRILAASLLAVACGWSLTVGAQVRRTHRNPQAAQLKNPVPADEASLDLGRRVYWGECASCHGELADGDSKMQWSLDPVPSNLVDSEWKYGSTDGEIFAVIRDGIDNTSMRPYSDFLTEPQIWSVVNYLRSIAVPTTER